ncbi:hypothetical protein [Haloarcula montana]|uniref:hypothetical protein n=1 Tax=Haloarcula montana TaxID=3111776 RepID=UPI002D79E9AD|nr:hypothetical protein [Haloarcula sp. GH36]
MADLFTHLLVPYILLTITSWRVDWLDEGWVVVGMGGAAIPDLQKIRIVFDTAIIRQNLGIPFSLAPFSTVGGVLLVAGLITLLFEREEWRRVYGLITFGGVTALVLDGMRAYADGRASAWLNPFTEWRPPTPSLYVSSDPAILIGILLLAVLVWFVNRQVVNS